MTTLNYIILQDKRLVLNIQILEIFSFLKKTC